MGGRVGWCYLYRQEKNKALFSVSFPVSTSLENQSATGVSLRKISVFDDFCRPCGMCRSGPHFFRSTASNQYVARGLQIQVYPVTTSFSPSPASVVRFVSSGVSPSVAVKGGGDRGRTAVAFQPLLNDAMAAANPKMETHI